MTGVVRAKPIRTTSGNLAGADFTGSNRVHGFSLRCTTAFSINIREGGAGGTILLAIDVPAATALGDSFPAPVHCTGPVYVEVLAAGSGVVGSIWVS